MTVEYALYKGEELLMVGSPKDVAAYLDMKVNSVYHWACVKNGEQNIKGYTLIKIEEDEVEENV